MEQKGGLWSWLCARRDKILLVISACALAASLLWPGVTVDPAWAAILLCGVPIVYGAGKALITAHDIKADLMVSLALVAAVAVGEYFAAGEVAVIMQLGTLLEDGTANRAKRGIEKLVRLTPKTARVRRAGAELVVPVEEAVPGETLVVLAGETIPLDGVILCGETTVDQQALTGESIPAEKGAGDAVLGGTVNGCGVLEIRATAGCADSTMQRMIDLARAADAEKAPVVGLADRWASRLVWVALGAAALTGIVSGELLRAVTVLVVVCPCAFVLATPTAVMAGIGAAARRGVLIRSGDALERLAQTSCVAFDKTGTLTAGKPVVTSCVPLLPGMTQEELLSLAARAELRSEHPLGKAIAARGQESLGAIAPPERLEIQTGLGVRATVGGKTVEIGSAAFLAQAGMAPDERARTTADSFAAKGASIVYCAADGVLCGLLALEDTLRPDARGAVGRLQALGLRTVLLSGDNEAAARTAADRAGVREVRAALLPAGKAAEIQTLEQSGEHVCMVGDGVNDALALRAAGAGIAMGGIGSDAAVEASDAVLVGEELARLPELFGLTRRVMTKIKQNILFSLAINLAAVLLSAFGVLSPVTGALWHNAGSVFVVVNAALLLRQGGKTQKNAEPDRG